MMTFLGTVATGAQPSTNAMRYASRVEVRNGEAVAMVRPFRRGIFSRVGLRVGGPMPTAEVTLERLQEGVRALID